MEVIRHNDRVVKTNGPDCRVWEFPSSNSNINIATAKINGREPFNGQAENTQCTELVFVQRGNGTITINENSPLPIYTGDVIIISPGEQFVWQGDLELIIICTPPWNARQHLIYLQDNT